MDDPPLSQVDKPHPALGERPIERVLAERRVAFWTAQILLVTIAACLPSEEIKWLTCRLMFGIVVSQCALAAIWLTLGPGRLSWRLLGAPVWLFVAVALGGVINRPSDAFWVMLCCGLAMATAIVVVILVARRTLGVRLASAAVGREQTPFQYRLKHMLILMLLTSLLLGLGRAIGFSQIVRIGPLDPIFFVATGAAWAVALLPMIFVALGARDRTQSAVGLVAAVMFAAFTAAAAFLIATSLPHQDRDVFTSLSIVGAIGFLLTLAGLLVLRWTGVRLVHTIGPSR